MMSTNKPTPKRITTPVGTASYPYLTRPDTKFNPDGEYRVGLILPASEAKSLIKTIDEAMTDSLKEAKAENPKKSKKMKQANPPYAELTDDEGNETGEVQINFKQKALIKPKNGQPFEKRPALFDSKGVPLPSNITIGSGSKLKVSFEIHPYYTDLVGAGVSLRLMGVQVLELVEYTGQSADSFGFEKEDGFEYKATDSNADDDDDFDDEADF